MGAVCSCLPVEDFEDYANRNSFSYWNCMCLRFPLQNFFHVYYSLFRRENVQAIPSSIEGTSLSSTESMDSSLADVYRTLPLPLPYDADPRYSCMHRDGLFPRHEKGTSDSLDVSEPVRRSDIVSNSESLSKGDNCTESTCEEGIKEQENCKSFKKLSSVESITVKGYFYSSLEDEDVCPTCLEEYTEENPKIITKCSHHFHLGCIYEWMERSENCPVCGK